jgi:hypothetical protein
MGWGVAELAIDKEPNAYHKDLQDQNISNNVGGSA